MIKARPKYSMDLYGSIYIDNIQKYVVICLFIKTTFPFDAGSRVDIVRHTSGYFFLCWFQQQKEILSEWLDKWEQLFEYLRCK
jgi:hypothetical protein